MSSEAQAPVLFERVALRDGRAMGVATLNAPRTLNGFSLPMAELLDAQLQQWAADPSVVLVLLQGAGEKAFCAGGDLHSLYQSMVDYRAAGHTDIRQNAYAARFFEVEYRVDYRIHTYPKPVLCWGHGIVMGGGIGLMSGASHRVVSEKSKLAFPEITVGLFPDVGGSWLLNNVPGNAGRFLALTGAMLGPGDAIFAGMADVHIPEAQRAAVVEAIAAHAWPADSTNHTSELTQLLASFAVAPAAGPLQLHRHAIDASCDADTLEQVIAGIHRLDDSDAWIATAQKTLAAGAPGSARLAFELLQRCKDAALSDVFRLEYTTALHCAAAGDFAEGIRALLIDKDRNPSWQPDTVAAASPAWAQAFFTSPWPLGHHPLADLGQDDTARN